MFIQYAGDGSRNSVGGETGERAKRESLNRPQLQYMEVLDAMNWTRWLVEVGASFCARVLFRDGSTGGMWKWSRRNRKKKAITKFAVTPTHGGFRRYGLDTVTGLARRIFL